MRRTVIMFTDLFFVLGLRVNDNFWDQVEEYVFEEFRGDVEGGPIV